MSAGVRGAQLAVGLVLAGLAAFTAARFSVTTDITAFLPPGGDQQRLALSRQIADSELSRTMVLTLKAADTATAARGSKLLETALREDTALADALSFVEGGPPRGTERAIYDLYHPRRLGFVASNPEQVQAALTDDHLRAAAQALKKQLAQPMSPLLSRLAPSDPLLVLTGLFDRLQGARGNELRVEDGRFVTQDGQYAVLFLGTRARAFDSEAQTPILQGIARAFADVNGELDGALELDQSGINRFAVRTERAIKGDIQRVSVLSVVGLALLMVVLFRSLRLVAMTSIPLGAGVLCGMASCLALYGRVHGMTLAFGASLLGVVIDYVVHLYCHHAVSPEAGGARGTLRAIGPALLTGAATTLMGFIALAGAGFPGLLEVAVFASAGILGALTATFVFLPGLLPADTKPVAARQGLVNALGRLLQALHTQGARLWALPALAVVIAAVGLPSLQMSHDFMSVDRLDPELLAEDKRVRGRVARFDQNRFVVALGDSEDEALGANTAVAQQLQAAVDAGNLEGFRSIATMLPSQSQQRAVQRAVLGSPKLGERLVAAFESEGFVGTALTPFLEHLRQPAAEPLTYQDLSASPLAPMVRPFRVKFGERVGFVTFLRGVQNADAVEQALSGIQGAVFLQQGEQLKQAHLMYQERTLQWLGVGLVAVLLLLAARYRDARRTFASFVPSLLAAAVTMAALSLTGRGLDLVVLTALLMVVSMGVDYGVFLVDAQQAEQPSAALLSVVVAAASTVLGFGLLAFSEHPLLQSIGVTASVGMVACLLLAPTTLVLVSTNEASRD